MNFNLIWWRRWRMARRPRGATPSRRVEYPLRRETPTRLDASESAAPPSTAALYAVEALTSTPSRRARERRHETRRSRHEKLTLAMRRPRSSRTSARTSRATPPASSASRRGWRVRSAASVDAAFMITRVPTPSTRCRRRDPQRVHASRLGRGDGVSATSRRRDAIDAAASAGDRENASTPSTRRVRHRLRPSQITRSSGIRKTRT